MRRPLWQHLSKRLDQPFRIASVPALPHHYPYRSAYSQAVRTPLPVKRYPRLTSQTTVQASYSHTAFVLLVGCGVFLTYEYLSNSAYSAELTTVVEEIPPTEHQTPIFSDMAVPQGYLGNLSAEQEEKLVEFWIAVLKVFGVQDQDVRPQTPVDANSRTASLSDVKSPDSTKRKSKRFSLFSRNHDDTPASPGKSSAKEEDDKYGQTAELRQILATKTPESLRTTAWQMLKADDPDALLLRFLRARKWDVDRALAMFVSTMHWRDQMDVDGSIMLRGEEGYKADAASADGEAQKAGAGFMHQLTLGKSMIHGTDKQGRPLVYVRARLHKASDQPEISLERYTIWVIETARLTLRQPVETACIIFDLTQFSLSNMDYAPVKFMIKVFEANYPESLGTILVHKAPWVFQGIWKIIRGWLDPVVAAKVHFTNSVEDMAEFIPKSQIITELEGDEKWEYKYIEGAANENDTMKDTATRDALQDERAKMLNVYQQKTFDWIRASRASDQEKLEKIRTERSDLSQQLSNNYWQLDPYIRARSLYDRIGMIERGGKIDFYPGSTTKQEEAVSVPN